MSKTDKTRPWRVQINDAPGMRAAHMCTGIRRLHVTAACDLPTDPWTYADTVCRWEPAREPVPHWKMFSDTGYRQTARRAWFSAERAAQRTILRDLTRQANSRGEINEDRVDNRQTHRYCEYTGGWWD
ncbi:hypothetical protein MMAG44476_37408 [Mycolicibacterium mageritense DSM 44476 = CIP 104973]|uniref:Molybdopterin oxidoreductase n=3 Tax=Mycolicibacterium TaxID=1866885 RepID=A0A100W7T6_MYCCR|nr:MULTISPECIES: hypothetical protein [Mycolicibacterium]MCC9185468.1 hypothetical protein [Mycolicibacterium mageritense]BBX37571.1 hypothetical protein MMAGJ_68530 [Mycolicibacterium mageritense]GAS93218.1 molybdopterin oxidoreductase [Mycolicibacterium canariasense]CDO25764.1 hypothetical protein BN978_06282 [Mycolicibacterium mageritense DSM 44476 = CIP 104973]